MPENGYQKALKVHVTSAPDKCYHHAASVAIAPQRSGGLAVTTALVPKLYNTLLQTNVPKNTLKAAYHCEENQLLNQ